MKACPIRSAAMAAGEATYFTGKPCVRGHVASRHMANGACSVCQAERKARIRRERPEATRQRDRDLYQRNIENERQQSRNWRLANPERARELDKESHARNKAKRNADSAAWRLANPDKWREVQASYARANPGKLLAHNQNRRARKRQCEGHFTADDIAHITKRQNGKCACCKKSRKLTVDHIQPLSKRGSNWPANLQMLCLQCNSAKNNRDPIEFMQRKGFLL